MAWRNRTVGGGRECLPAVLGVCPREWRGEIPDSGQRRRGVHGTKVHEVMTDRPRCVTPETPISVAAQLMETDDIGSLPILAGEELVGMVTDRDIVIRAVAKGKDPRGMPVSEVASESWSRCMRPMTSRMRSGSWQVSRFADSRLWMKTTGLSGSWLRRTSRPRRRKRPSARWWRRFPSRQPALDCKGELSSHESMLGVRWPHRSRCRPRSGT